MSGHMRVPYSSDTYFVRVQRIVGVWKEVQKIVVFGSFLHSDNPHDLDVAVFQDSAEPYLPLVLKYRQKTRSIARRIPLDILPLKPWTADDPFLAEMAKGEVVYER
jgi:hypothetical protein